jgi:phenylacetic acid degradation operon negative regulatory protein
LFDLYGDHLTSGGNWTPIAGIVRLLGPADRAARRRVKASLGYLGYAPLAQDTWVAPRVSADLADSLAGERLDCKQFFSSYASGDALAAELWDLEELAATYRRFIGTTRELAAGLGPDLIPESAFAIRFLFVHDWRRFLFLDPDLPMEVLPPDWPGHEAAVLFNTTAASLLPLAREFVDSCLSADNTTRS